MKKVYICLCFYVGTQGCSFFLFISLFHTWYIFTGYIYVLNKSSILLPPSPWSPLKPLGLLLPSEREYGTDFWSVFILSLLHYRPASLTLWRKTGLLCILISPPSSLLSDVDKPTIWLETTAVDDICAELPTLLFLIQRVLVLSHLDLDDVIFTPA